MPGFVSEPNFEEDISIEVEDDDQLEVRDRDIYPDDDSEDLQDLK